MRLDQAIDIKYDGNSAKQIYYNNKLIWPQVFILPISGLLWGFVTSPSGKALTNFNIEYDGGQVTANWGDGSSQILTSAVNYNNTFLNNDSTGINLILENGANITKINCGTSTPKLNGFINLSGFATLTDFTCIGNDITAINGYEQNSNLINFIINQNQISEPLNLSLNTGLKNFQCHVNNISGPIPNINNNQELVTFACYNNRLSGTFPDISTNTKLQNFQCQNQTGTAKISGTLSDISNLTNLRIFRCNQNQITGQIINLDQNISLTNFSCNGNLLSGSIPNLSNNSNLLEVLVHNNYLTGSIPDLSNLTSLTIFHCYTQYGTIKITDFAGGSVSNTLGNFLAQNNQLSATAVNAILAAFVAANRTAGTRILNLGGGGNAAPTGQGITDKATLQSRGWTVTTN